MSGPEPFPPDAARRRELEHQITELSRRFSELSEQVSGAGAAGAPVDEALEELSAALEELEVAAEEIHAQNEALAAAQLQIDLEAARFRDLFDLAPDGYVVTDTSGVVVEANRSATELLGAPEPALVGKPLVIFADSADRLALLGGMRVGVEGGAVIDVDVRFAPRGAAPFPASVRISAEAPYLAAGAGAAPGRVRWLIRDITARARAEAALAESEARYRLIADNATDVVVTTDRDGLVTYTSPSARPVLGVAPGALEGRLLLDLVHPNDRAALAPVLEQAITARLTATITCRAQRRDGGYLPVEARVGPLIDRRTAALTGTWAAIRDVRDREVARIGMQAALARERETARALRDAGAVRDTLLLAVAHDLRSPVAAAAHLAEHLAEHEGEITDDQARRIGAGIAESTRQLARVLANLLDLERLVGGHVAVQRQTTDLVALVAMGASRAGLPEAAADLPPGPVEAEVDPGLTERIIDNLLANALQHTQKGSSVRVGLVAGAEGVTLTVDDDGAGIDDELKEAVFEAFYRQPGVAGGGLGLGLHLVRRFAEIQGGRAWVEDAPGGGASFRVLLPTR